MAVEYSNSPLVDYIALTTKFNPRQSRDGLRLNPDGRIKKITIHHAAGKVHVESLGKMFAPEVNRTVSSNYGIGLDGRKSMYVEEKNRAWTSSSPENDYQAITIEVSNCSLGPNWEVSDVCLESLIELCADICKRNEIPRLEFTGDKTGSLTSHDMFAPTLCPGPYLKSKFTYICDRVNKSLELPDVEVEEGVDTVTEVVLKKGDALNLDGVNLYGSSTSTRRSSTKTGTFWVWGSDVINGRIRITNSEDLVGVSGQVTGYINYEDAVASAVSEGEPTDSQSSTETQTSEVTPPQKTAEELAEEILKGQWGSRDDRKSRLISAGYTESEISEAQKIVDSRTSVDTNVPRPLFEKGDRVTISSTATVWATGQRIPQWVKQKTLYVRSDPKNFQCQVSTLPTGAVTGIAYLKDLRRK